jgi:hypothetical protein
VDWPLPALSVAEIAQMRPKERDNSMKRLAIISLVMASLAMAPAANASPSSTHGFAGNWQTTDCAQFDGDLHCDIWGDGSHMTLNIGRGDTPRVSFQDSYASSCDNAGSPSTRWVGQGKGYYFEIWLFAPLSKTGCGTYQAGSGVELQFYYDTGSDTLWEDEDGDGYGLIWYRAP